MICKIVSALIVDTNINRSPCLILKLAIPECLIQTVAHIEGSMIKRKKKKKKIELRERLRESPHENQYLHNFGVAHTLTKASTTCINH